MTFRLAPLILMALSMTASMARADRNLDDCFPACPTVAEPVTHGADAPAAVITLPAPVDPANAENSTSCPATPSWVKGAEGVNARIKPVKEWVGYLRSPQGLALKLVNDHVVRIPAWVVFALDPVGTVKHKAIEEVRQRAKDAMLPNRNCEPVPEADKDDWDRSIDAA